MSRQSELAQLGRVFDSGPLSNRNLIINGAMQVAQRGTSFASDGYTLDRWYSSQNSSTTTYTDASGQKWLDYTSNGNSFASVTQKIEDGLYRVRNQTITLSFDWEQVTAGSTAEVRFFNNVDLDQYIAIPSPSVSERKVITVSIGNVGNGAGGWLGLAFYNATATGASGRFRISNVQLEAGDTATPFEHRSYGQELALCQRYFQRFSYGQYNYFGIAVAPTGTSDALTDPKQFIVPMRANPTGSVARTDGSPVLVNIGAGNYNITSLVVNTFGGESHWWVQGISSLPTREADFYEIGGSGTTTFDLDAEL